MSQKVKCKSVSKAMLTLKKKRKRRKKILEEVEIMEETVEEEIMETVENKSSLLLRVGTRGMGREIERGGRLGGTIGGRIRGFRI